MEMKPSKIRRKGKDAMYVTQLMRIGWSTMWFTAITILLTAGFVHATPVTKTRTEANIDWVSAGVGGAGGGTGTINLTGVSGTVTKAFLFWHGVNNSGTGAAYNNPTVSIDGNAVTGVTLGDATTNCWGSGSSRAFRADVTPYISGNGTYTITGLSALSGHNANGASLVVIFNDGNPANNRDLVFFEGNDSNIPEGFPGEDDGWNATLADISYGGSPVSVQLHVADGQSFSDGPLTFVGSNSVTIPDTSALYDGNSVPTAGTSRASNGALWDIHSLDITAAFGAPGLQTLSLSGVVGTSDCLGLVVLLMDLEAGSAPGIEGPAGSPSCSDGVDNDVDGLTDNADPNCQGCGNGNIESGEQCDDGNTINGDGCSATCQIEIVCGNGHLDSGEQCDDGNTTSNDGCSATCVTEYCGDGIPQSGIGEECDDGKNGNNGDGCTDSCLVNYNPVCTNAAASIAVIWPPNHQGVNIGILGVTDVDGDPLSISATNVFQDEQVNVNGDGAGATSPDASLSPLQVRAERNGNPQTPGNGRVYHINFTATDGFGGSCTGEVRVCVPHDQKKPVGCIDGGPLYNSLVP